MSYQHSCKLLNEIGNSLGFSVSVRRRRPEPDAAVAWYLEYRSLATADEVRSKEASTVGEELAEIRLLIEYCPYCGEKLGE